MSGARAPAWRRAATSAGSRRHGMIFARPSPKPRLIERIQFSGQWARAWRAGLLTTAPHDDAPWLRQTALPTLILHGQHDYRFPADHTAELATLPHIRRVILPGAGHLAHLERKARWSAAVSRFVTDLEAGRAL